MFQIGPREESPVANNMMFNNASPTAIFSTPSSDSNDAYNNNASSTWNNTLGQTPTWQGNFNMQYGQAEGFAMTPSPMGNSTTSVIPAQASGDSSLGYLPLHIAPISTKSRVETQINIIMTLEKPCPGVEYLHLPLHTIAKSKLLAKEQYDRKKALELHAMLVCTSAMNNTQLREKALKRAALQDNLEVQRRAERLREVSDEDKNNMTDVDDADKPSNGGEVRICSNCIQRERKRAGRKKLKKEEEQQHWERFETERVVVFNSNEYLPFKPYDASNSASREGNSSDDANYVPPDGALQVSAAMRIACYCRHQSEKEGFRVIFTLKDCHNNVVAQQMSDSILITDDHKTHPPNFSNPMSGDVFYQNSSFPSSGLPTSYSMVDLSAQVHSFPSSRSTGNLQAMGYGQTHYNAHSHIHQMPSSGYASQTTSATMTPTSLSRPASPSSAGQAGPNKKRKSSSFHRRVPSGLTMTPRVDTAQTSSANASGSGSISQASFSPSSTTAYNSAGEPSYMAVPNNAAQAGYYGSGPPTPANETTQYFNQAQIDMARSQNAAAYFSHPSSAVPSRANSPVLQTNRPSMTNYGRQPIQTPTNSIQGRQAVYGGQVTQGLTIQDQDRTSPPTITKITPPEGPVSGGTEVSIYGYNFTNGTQVMFGDQLATTVFYGPQALLATAPPSRPGGVNVTLVPLAGNSMQFVNPTTSRQVFTYMDTNPRMMEMALRFLSQQQTGSQMPWNQFTNQVATKFMQSGMNAGNMRAPGFDGANMMALMPAETEDMLLHILELIDLEGVLNPLQYDLENESGATMLSLACTTGMYRIATALLARGANPDVRDVGGFTPLMHAALQAHVEIFRLLMRRGADPALRSLNGFCALDLVPAEVLDECLYIVQNTPRCRYDKPVLCSQSSYASITPSNASWDISSASLYESEMDTTSQPDPLSKPASRRPSFHSGDHESKPCPSAMLVWRDALTAQIQQLQQNMQAHLPQIQLPALPPPLTLPDYQDLTMLRRLSSLLSRERTATPPPAYDDLFPSPTHIFNCSKKRYSRPSTKSVARLHVMCPTASIQCLTGLFLSILHRTPCISNAMEAMVQHITTLHLSVSFVMFSLVSLSTRLTNPVALGL